MWKITLITISRTYKRNEEDLYFETIEEALTIGKYHLKHQTIHEFDRDFKLVFSPEMEDVKGVLL